MPCIMGQAWASSDTKGRRATINLVGYCFCTYVTGVRGPCACGMYTHSSDLCSGVSAVVSIGHTHSMGCNYARLSQQLHEQHALLYLSSCTYIVQSFFFCSAVSAAWHSLSRLFLCFLFSSVVSGSFVGHFESMMVPFQQPCNFTLRTWYDGLSIPLDSCSEHGC